MAAQLDPNMGMDPSMERTLQQEEEEDQYNNSLEDAIHQEQSDAGQGVPPPSPPLPALASSLVWSSSVDVCLSLELEDVHCKHHCPGGSVHCTVRKFVITNKSDVLMQMRRHMTVIIYSSFRPGLSRKQKGRLLRS